MDLNALTVGQPEKLLGGMKNPLSGCKSVEEACQSLCREMYEQCRSGGEGERSLLLSRAYVAMRYEVLEPDLARQMTRPENGDASLAGTPAAALPNFLALLGTYGKQTAWCDRRRLSKHRVVDLRESVPSPLLKACLDQLGFDPARDGKPSDEPWIPRGLFVVEDATGGAALEGDDDMLRATGVRSIVGSAARLPDGAISFWVGFCRHPVFEEGVLPLLTLMPQFWLSTSLLYRNGSIFWKD